MQGLKIITVMARKYFGKIKLELFYIDCNLKVLLKIQCPVNQLFIEHFKYVSTHDFDFFIGKYLGRFSAVIF